VATAVHKAKAVHEFLCVRDFILTLPKLRFDVERCTFVKQSFGFVKFDRFLQVMPSLHRHNVVPHTKQTLQLWKRMKY